MDFKDLVYLEAIDRHRNLTYAAQELFITQPALTKFLKSFESSLGVELFRWTGNHMVPTDVGNQYLIFAREVLAKKKQLEASISMMNGGKSTLRIGMPISRTAAFTDVILRFGQQYPHIELTLVENFFTDIEKALLECQIDVAFLSNFEQNQNLVVKLLSQDKILLYIPPQLSGFSTKHVDFSPYPWVDLKELIDFRFLLPPENQTLGLYSRKIFQTYGFYPKKQFPIRSMEAKMRLAQQGYGICLYSPPPAPVWWSLPPSEKANLYSFGTKKEYSSFYAIYSKKLPFPFYVNEFIRFMEEVCKRSPSD